MSNIDSLQAENKTLRQRIAALEQEVERLQKQEQISHNVEEELQNKVYLLEALLDTIPNPVFYKDNVGRYRDCNTLFAAEIFGLPKEKIIGKNLAELSEILPPDLKEVYQKRDEELITDTGHQVYESQVRCSDGKRHDFIFSKATFFDRSGSVAGIVGIMTDITERKQTEQEWRTFYTLAEYAPDGITVSSLTGRVTYANKAFYRMYGYGEETMEMMISDFFADVDKPLAAEIVKNVFEQGTWQGVGNCQCQNGRIMPVQMSVFLIQDEQQRPHALVAIHRDITENVEREKALRESKEQIIFAQQEALRELGTPLLPLLTGVLAMPLIGNIDDTRAQQVMETLLEGVASHNAEIVILDITGVQTVDDQIAKALVESAQAVRLLGAQVVLTGIGPAMAQTLVMLGADLSEMVTRSTLQDGIVFAMKR